MCIMTVCHPRLSPMQHNATDSNVAKINRIPSDGESRTYDFDPAEDVASSKYTTSLGKIDLRPSFRVASCCALVANNGEISIVASGSEPFVATSIPADLSHRAARRIWS